jgi:VanZ family protein
VKRAPLLLAYAPLVAAVTTLSVISHLSNPPIPELMHFRFADKLMHFGAYFVVGALALVGSARRRLSLGRAAVVEAVLIATLHGALDELHQGFVPGRDASFGDLAADFLGASLGAWLCAWLLSRYTSLRPTMRLRS